MTITTDSLARGARMQGMRLIAIAAGVAACAVMAVLPAHAQDNPPPAGPTSQAGQVLLDQIRGAFLDNVGTVDEDVLASDLADLIQTAIETGAVTADDAAKALFAAVSSTDSFIAQTVQAKAAAIVTNNVTGPAQTSFIASVYTVAPSETVSTFEANVSPAVQQTVQAVKATVAPPETNDTSNNDNNQSDNDNSPADDDGDDNGNEPDPTDPGSN